MLVVSNHVEMIDQTEQALARIEAGSYGRCENCGQPIGKARLQAYPTASLCIDCKQKEERR
jgi:RNA polymerase-binding protein DksA